MFKAQPNEDDEWIKEEEKKPDLTGLKIQELVLNSDEEEEREEQEVEEERKGKNRKLRKRGKGRTGS
jgi:hypothetical protein